MELRSNRPFVNLEHAQYIIYKEKIMNETYPKYQKAI